MVLFSFIESLNTMFGISIYEPVAKTLAKGRFKKAESQIAPHNQISSEAHRQIQTIMGGLTTASRDPNKSVEIEKLKTVCQSGKMNSVKLTKVDIWLVNIWLEGTEEDLFLIDLKTVKPNIGDFQGYKCTLLEWAAAELEKTPNVNVSTMIGIPYNLYEPEPYKRWTMRGMFDIPKEILVMEELWDFIGGDGTYQDLLDSFEMAGLELRSEIDEYFSKFAQRKF